MGIGNIFGSESRSTTNAVTNNNTSTTTNVGVGGPDLANIVTGIGRIVGDRNNAGYQPLTGYTPSIPTPAQTANETEPELPSVAGIPPLYLYGAIGLVAILIITKKD